MGLMGVMGVIGLMSGKPEKQNRSAQLDSEIFILKNRPKGLLAVRLVPLCGNPSSPLVLKTTPAQWHSKMSNAETMGERVDESMGQQPIESTLPQTDSKMSTGSMGERVDESMGQQPIKNTLPQADSKMLAVRLVPQSGDPTSPAAFPASA
jgi:hypothetical protein